MVMPMSAEWQTPTPDVQRVTFVAVRGEGADARSEALQAILAGDDRLEPQALIVEARRIAIGTPNTFEEHQRQQHWGATGLFVQEIVIAYFAGVGSGLTVEAIRAALSKLMTGSTASRPVLAKGDSHELAWHAFATAISSAFDVTGPTLIEGRKEADAWSFKAQAGGVRFEGTVSEDGHWVHVRKV